MNTHTEFPMKKACYYGYHDLLNYIFARDTYAAFINELID